MVGSQPTGSADGSACRPCRRTVRRVARQRRTARRTTIVSNFSFTLALVQTCLCYPLFRSDMYTYPMLFISMLYSQMEMTRRMPVLSSRRGRLISSLPSLLAPVIEPRTRVFSLKQVAAALGGPSLLLGRRPQRKRQTLVLVKLKRPLLTTPMRCTSKSTES